MKRKPVIFLYLLAVIFAGVLIFKEIDTPDIFSSERQIKYTLYVGLNDKDTNAPVFGHEEARTAMFMIVRKHTGGCTFYDAQGYWFDTDANETYTENTLVCVLLDTSPEAVKAIMDEALTVFNQSSILLETSEVRGTFYSN